MSGPIGLRPVTEQDGFLIRRWLREASARAGLGNRASAEAEIALARMSASALCRIVTAERGLPIGYAQAVEVGLSAGLKPPEMLPGTWDLQFMLAASGRRAALAAVPAVLAAEVFATTLAVACCGLISIRQETVVRAYERAGFRWRRIWNDPLFGPAWLMLKERPR
ncbi:MAG TPA: hypothetical protein VKF35_03980 [Hyphomicrobiaceae bacterium]|nr:hypothetical protein [Hyphomicrobiaceae bacterium]